MDSTKQSWVQYPEDHHFTIYNLPYGIFSTEELSPRLGMAIGDQVVHMEALRIAGGISAYDLGQTLLQHTMNDYIALGKSITVRIREDIQSQLCDPESILARNSNCLISMSEVKMHLPVSIGDYTDFYSSKEHATNLGMMFRDPDNALLPNWLHLPVGYHGRSSSIVVSGTDIKRPSGQTKPVDGPPVYGQTKRLDFELEMAFIVGAGNQLGRPISIDHADEHIFGMVIFNDWSARDIQKWEYVPLGPFLGKSFASSISPWVVTMEAMQPFAVKAPNQDPEVLPYLQSESRKNYDLSLEVAIKPESEEALTVSRSNFKYMYWTMQQQLAHHTINGCNVRVGDVMASGTISGVEENSYGSLLEITWAGKKPIVFPSGTTRKFLEDGDVVSMTAYARKGEVSIGFGEVRGKIVG